MAKELQSQTLRCAVYAAVSTGAQAADDKVSIDVQLRQGRDVAARHGATIIAELIVPGQSRSIDLWEDAVRDIPAFSQLAQLLHSRSIDVLIFLNWSRLARTESLGAAVRALCRRAKVQLYDLSSPPREFGVPEYNQGRSIVDAVLTIGAQAEVEELVRRHREGMIGRVRAGKIPSGTPPWGYLRRFRPDGTEYIEIDEDAAPWVRNIFQWYLGGESGITIADRLRAAGLTRPKGARWDFWFVYGVLDLAWRYAGYGEVNRKSGTGRPYVRARGNWPPIIDEETAERTFAERAQRKGNRGLADASYVLSGVVWCATCGGRMRVQHWHNTGRMQLLCERRHPGCTIPYKRVMDRIRAAIHTLAEVGAAGVSDEVDTSAQEQEIQRASRTLQQLVAARQRANDLYVMGHITIEDYAKMVGDLKAKIDETQARLHELDAAMEEEIARGSQVSRLQDVIDVGLEVLDSSGPAANAWLRQHVQVWVENCKVVDVKFL
jgi:DNA invertase Pin-like site-specific DNA recombinase